MATAEITQITVKNRKVGIIGLENTIIDMPDEYAEKSDKEIGIEMIRRLSRKNYIPDRAVDNYGKAFIREFRKHLGQDYKGKTMNLDIRWQRLLDAKGATCERCQATGDAVELAAEKLRQAFRARKINVSIQKIEITWEEFCKNPQESSRVWLNGKSLEVWIGADVGQSPCCGPCGDQECRTISVFDNTYEQIPEHLILKAGFLAAADLLDLQVRIKSNVAK